MTNLIQKYKNIDLSLFLLVCWIFIGSLSLPSYADEDILIVTEEWAPYNYLNNGEIIGVSTDVVMHLLDILNKRYKIELLPSMRSSYMLNTRLRTMMFSMFRTPERESQYKWIGPISDGSIYFYKNKDSNFKMDNLNDLKNTKLSICSRQAGLIHNLLKKQGFKNLDNSTTTGLHVYKMLLAGRCDIAISDTDLGVRHILKTLGLNMQEAFEKTPFPFFEAQLYLVANKDISDEEIQQWQSALETLKANGTYEEIIQKYH